MRDRVTPTEWRWVLAWSWWPLLLTSFPYLLAAALATDERAFGGFVYAVEDGYSYLAKMRLGAEGAWLFRIAYTPEPHHWALFFPFHILLGKVARLLPGGDLTTCMVWTYHGARLVCGLLLLLMVYRFLAAFTERIVVRRWAWLLVTWSGGLGWLLVVLGQPGWLGSMPLDFILPEGFTFLVLYGFPHIALARALLLVGMVGMLHAWGWGRLRSDLRSALGSGLAWLTMGLIVPFYVAVAWAVLGGAWVVWAVRRRRIPWRALWMAALAMAVSAPIVLYSAWMFTVDPVYQVWGTQNRILSPHPLHYLVAYGVPLAWAAVSLRDVWRDAGPGWWALAWVGVVPLLVYLPINIQRRLVEGVQVPLSLLAAWGMVRVRESLRRMPQGWMAAVLVTLSLTNVLLIGGNCLALRGLPAPIYRDVEEIAALDWLAGEVDFDDVVLTAYETGNYLPARVAARAFVGHGPESVHAEEKKALVARFFSETSETVDRTVDDRWRQRLLREYGVDYVFWGPAERRLGAFDPTGASYLRPVYRSAGYIVFRVELEKGEMGEVR